MTLTDTAASYDPGISPGGISNESIAEALDLRDSLGVLSLYVDARGGPLRRAETRMAASSVRDLLSDWPDSDTPPVRRTAAEIERRLRIRRDGHSRAIFAALSSGRVVDVRLPVAIPAFTALDSLAHARPLLEAIDKVRPAGVVELSASRLTAAEDRGVVPHQVDAVDLARREMRWQARRGLPGAPSAPARQPGPGRDQHERRRQVRLRAAAGGFARRVHALAVRNWDVIVVTGARTMVDGFARRFPVWETDLVKLPPSPLQQPGSAQAARVAEEVARIRAARAARLATEVAKSRTAIWGMQGTLAAMRARRVAHLLVAADLEPADAERAIREAIASEARLTLVPPGPLGEFHVVAVAQW